MHALKIEREKVKKQRITQYGHISSSNYTAAKKAVAHRQYEIPYHAEIINDASSINR